MKKSVFFKLISICLVAILVGSFAGCTGNQNAEPAEHSFVKITMENGDSFIMELYPEYAPETVENFVTLVKSGFYDGLTFHRVIKDFMAQGGDPKGDGTGGSDKEIKGEFKENGFTQNTLSHDRGVVSMARSNEPDSASSQFFICYSGNYKDALDGKYAAFGKVIEGMEVVDSFLEIERSFSASDNSFSKPTEPIVMKKAEVIDYTAN
ncbi:MAG: peptidylprolyl isomerase [Clostridia bacterium]|nr:peptidylprolyl isomerase [Clostridia bacterium]